MKLETGVRMVVLLLVIMLGFGGYRQYQKRARPAANPASATSPFAFHTCELHGGREPEPGYCSTCALPLVGIRAASVGDSPPLGMRLVLGDIEAEHYPHEQASVKRYQEAYQAQYRGTFEADPFQKTTLRAPFKGQMREWFIEAMDFVQLGKKLGTFHSPEINRAIEQYNTYAQYENNGIYAFSQDIQDRLQEAKKRLAQLGVTNLEPAKLSEIANGRPVAATLEGYAINLLDLNKEVSSGSALLEIVPRSAFRVIAYFAESDLKETTIGKTVDLEFTASVASPGARTPAPTSGRSSRRTSRTSRTAAATPVQRKFTGQIAFIGTVLNPALNGYEVRITSGQWPTDLPSGATGTVQWGATRGTGILVLPSAAIMETPRGPIAFKWVRGQTYQPTRVTEGQVTPGGVEIRLGLQEGDRVLGDVQWLSRLAEERNDF